MIGKLDLGAFSVSLTVADLAASRTFYEALGFEVTGGSAEENYLILVNGPAVIGLFHGMFDKNILTFNPGLQVPDEVGNMPLLEEFTDVRDIQARLTEAGLTPVEPIDAEGTDPANIVVIDPDGNPVLIDQFFPRPG